MIRSDIIVIGAGIAGASAAAELAAHARVTLLEMEAQPGYHATGRSAAYFAAAYGKRVVRELTGCCEAFFRAPPDGFSELRLLRPRDCMFFGRPDQSASLQAMQEDNPELKFLDADEVRRRVPAFAEGYLHGALREPRGGDLDVDAILQGYLRLFRRRGGTLLGSRRATALHAHAGAWRVTAGGEEYEAGLVVNAAGAWADRVARLAGLEGLGIRPFRRTALTVAAPAGVDIREWPNMIDADEDFYFKPEAGHILISPADETPCEPCDAQPEDFDVALGVDRFERATGMEIRRVEQRWAGLRTFAPDRLFVSGFDPRSRGFFWLAGQGGYGIQSAPALAQLTRWLILGSAPEPGFGAVLEHVAAVAPDRLL
ncbi:MAG: FAD-binding oxidoreductase [Lysobacterales bacterium]|nr:MAG: FAD-binding oxidoreductase [Xanthomonadales bacterium]